MLLAIEGFVVVNRAYVQGQSAKHHTEDIEGVTWGTVQVDFNIVTLYNKGHNDPTRCR